MTPSKIFLYFCLSFIIGIFLNSFFNIGQVVLLGFLILAIFFIAVFWKRFNLGIIGFCILFLILGIIRYELAETKAVNSEIQKYNDKDTVIFSGIVSAEPDIRENHIKLEIDNIFFNDNDLNKKAEGKILITTEKYSGYEYGDKLKITGKLQTPQVFDEFNYRDYLKKDGIYSVSYYPKIELADRGQGSFIYSQILSFKNNLREVVYKNLSPPQSSILAAMLLGDKRQISEEWNEKLSYAGVRHLTAISGMHITILTAILMSFLIGLGFWRQQAFYLTIILIFLFIIMIGLQPSAVRAGIMAGFFLLGQHLGRLNISSRAIIFAASLILFFNPFLLALDIGFQLSFLAMLGMIYFLPLFRRLLSFLPDFLELKDIFSMTISAQIFTLPILIYNFGYFSAVAPIANILIVPFLPFLIGTGFIFVLTGVFSNFLAWIFSLPVLFFLSYLIKIVDFFSGLSFSVYFVEIPWFLFLFFYAVLAFIIYRFNKKQRLDFLNYS